MTSATFAAVTLLYLSQFLWSGLGVRGAVLLAGLTPVYGPGTALGVAVSYRVVTSLGDGIGFLLGFVAEKRLARAPT